MDMPAFQEIVYERPRVEDFRDCVMRVRLKIMTARNADHVEKALMDFQKEYSRFETAMAVCAIRHSLDVADPVYAEETAFFEAAYPQVLQLMSLVYSALVRVSEREACEEKFGSMVFLRAQNRLETISDGVVPLLAREATLVNEYEELRARAVISCRGVEYNLSTISVLLESADRDLREDAFLCMSAYDAEVSTRLDGLFDELVRLRTEIAVKLGYRNFVDLGHKRMLRLDYSREQIRDFREMVRKYIVPVTSEIRRLQEERLGVGALKFFDYPVLFASGNPEPVVEAEAFPDLVSTMFKQMFEQEQSFFDVLYSHGFVDSEPRDGKMTGGYCSTLPDYGIPFVFLNANRLADDVTTMIHECGHAYAAIRSADASAFLECLSPGMETCEIHSTAMEYLSYPYMEMFFGERAENYRELHMTRALLFLPYCCMVDAFQEAVYEHPEFSAQQRHKVWKDLEAQYQPFLQYDGCSLYEKGGAWQKKGHIFTDPFYYIDYGLALVVSLELWDISVSHYRKALMRYDQLCIQGGTAAFQQIFDTAGLGGPFDESTMKRIAYKACSFLSL